MFHLGFFFKYFLHEVEFYDCSGRTDDGNGYIRSYYLGVYALSFYHELSFFSSFHITAHKIVDTNCVIP